MKLGLREAVFVVLLMAIPVVAWWSIFRPQAEVDRRTMQQIEAKRQSVAQLNATTAMIGDMESEIAALERGIVALESKLPGEMEIDKVLREITRLAERNQLATPEFRVARERMGQPAFADPDAPHVEQPIKLKLTGDYRGFYAFLLSMEAQDRIMRIRDMTLKRPERMQEGFVEADLELAVFFERGRSGM